MAAIIRSPAARRDLDEAWDYIARDNPPAAERLLRAIGETCEMPAGSPLLGEEWPELGDGIRFFTVRRNYVIIYRPAEDGIEVVRIVHAARDIPSLFDD